jgi:predicted O-methyltransferase YrrM
MKKTFFVNIKKQQFPVLVEKIEQELYVAEYPPLGIYSIYGKTLNRLLNNIQETISICLALKKIEYRNLSELIKVTEGFMSIVSGKLLFNLAKQCEGEGVIVEIGSWKGTSTICLAKGSRAGKKIKVYAIDHFTGLSEHKAQYGKFSTFDDFQRNIKAAKVNDLITPIAKTSEEAAKNFNKPIEFIFIDGAHEYELVKLDFELWYPKVIIGGLMAFHDSTRMDGPVRVVEKFVYNSGHFENIQCVDTITFARKIK